MRSFSNASSVVHAVLLGTLFVSLFLAGVYVSYFWLWELRIYLYAK
jgi:hypothetical protein